MASLLAGCARVGPESEAKRKSDKVSNNAQSDLLPSATLPYIDIVLRPRVVPVRQTSANTCWAAVWTMLLTWREGRQMSLDAAVSRLGPEWTDRLKKDAGLEAQTFNENNSLKASGLQAKPPANYLPSVYVELMASRGPLWINMGNGILNHAMLLVSAQTRQDHRITFRFVDPQSGTYITKSDKEFFADFEREARFIVDHKLNWEFRYQIFYW